MQHKPQMMLWLSDTRGVYIPRDFALSFKDRASAVTGVDDETWKTLEAGPDHEWYWEAWDDVCRDAIVTNEHGDRYFPYQDGDCWLIPCGMEWSEDEQGFVWPDETDEHEPNESGFHISR